MLVVVVLTFAVLIVVAICWTRMGPGSDFEVITDPTREQLRKHYALNTAAIVVLAGLTFLSMPTLSADQPADGFVLEGGRIWFLPALFFFLAAGGIVAMYLSILWLGGIVSREKKVVAGGLPGRAGAAAEGWGRKNPRGMLLAFAAFLLVTAPFTALATGVRVAGSSEGLTVDGLFELQPQTVPWSDVQQIVLRREVTGDGKRQVTLQFELADGRVEELQSTAMWPLSDEFLGHFVGFCRAHSLPLRQG